jgi:hypothetical protein
MNKSQVLELHLRKKSRKPLPVALAFTEAGSPATKNTKLVFVKRFPFSVVYRPDWEGIVDFAVAHHSRKPGYWAQRV